MGGSTGFLSREGLTWEPTRKVDTSFPCSLVFKLPVITPVFTRGSTPSENISECTPRFCAEQHAVSGTKINRTAWGQLLKPQGDNLETPVRPSSSQPQFDLKPTPDGYELIDVSAW